MRYLEAGSGHALVWLHAFPLSADQFIPQLHQSPQGWRVIAPDLRGFRGPQDDEDGSPERPLSAVSVDTYAADVLELLRHLGVARAVVGGVSMGGYVAFAMARLAPEFVSGLVLANTRATPDSVESRANRDRMIVLAGREGAAGVARAMLAKLIGEAAAADQPALVDAVRDLILANAPDAIAAGLRALRDRPDATPGLAALRCPSIVIHGADDAIITREESEAMHRALSGSMFAVLPRVGHLSNLENPEGFNAAVADFLARSVIS